MKKVLFLCVLPVLFLLLSSRGYGQVAEYYEAPKLYLGSANLVGKMMEVGYEITTPGYVELHLIDANGKKVWIKGQVRNKKVTYTFKIPTEPMTKNMRYEYLLRFKGKEEKSFFSSPTE
jgi:hypothetical protein